MAIRKIKYDSKIFESIVKYGRVSKLRKPLKDVSSYDTAKLMALSGKLVGERLEFTGGCCHVKTNFDEKEINTILKIFLPKDANAYWVRRENINSGARYKEEKLRINFYNIDL